MTVRFTFAISCVSFPSALIPGRGAGVVVVAVVAGLVVFVAELFEACVCVFIVAFVVVHPGGILRSL